MGESSASIHKRVQTAQDIQHNRFINSHSTGVLGNADMCIGRVRQFCKLQDEGQLNLSARAYHRTRSVKLARPSADLAGREEIQSPHLAEALHASQSSEVDDGTRDLLLLFTSM